MALWPFTRDYYKATFEVFPAISRRYWLSEFWVYNVRALSVELVMPRPLESPRVAFQLRASATRVVHVVRLTSVEQVDDELLGWLTEAYDYATGEP